MLDWKKVLEDKKFTTLATNLFIRWLDESEYEDINEYAEVLMDGIKKANGSPLEVKDVVACKRPFGVKFTTPCDNKRWQFKHTTTYYSLKRIK